jgi:hypothetical protein
LNEPNCSSSVTLTVAADAAVAPKPMPLAAIVGAARK